MAKLLDNQFSLFGFRFGIDPILGLFPGVGDFLVTSLGFYIIIIAIELKLPKLKITQMLFNIMLDFVVGLIPILGDIFDFTFKANSRNLDIIKKSL